MADLKLELTNEIPHQIVKIFAIPDESNNLTFINPLVILTETSCYLINGENNSIYRSFNFQDVAKSPLIDCKYAKELTSFIILSKDSLYIVPQDSKNISLCKSFLLPKRSIQLLDLHNKSAIIELDGNFLLHIYLDSTEIVYLKNSESFLPVISKENTQNKVIKHFLSSKSNQISYLLLSTLTKSNANQSKPKSAKQDMILESKSSMLIQVLTWDNSTLQQISSSSPSKWLNESNSITCNLSLLNNDMMLEIDSIVDFATHSSSSSMSIIIANNNKFDKNGEWIKIANNNHISSVLFRRQFIDTPANIHEHNHCVWFSFSNNKSLFSCYDIKYGTHLQSINISVNNMMSKPFILSYGDDFQFLFTVTNSTENKNNSLVSGVHKSSSLYRCIVAPTYPTIKSSNISLSHALGRLHSTKSSDHFIIQNYENDDNDTANANETDLDSNNLSNISQVTNIINDLSGYNKRKLMEAYEEYQVKIKQEKEILDNIENNDNDIEIRMDKRRKQFYLDIPEKSSKAFLTRLENCDDASHLSLQDWDMLKVLLRSNTVSLASNPSLIRQSIQQHRFDVLAFILRYVSDLNEKQSMKILHLLIILPDKSYSHMEVINGVISYQPFPITIAPTSVTEATDLKSTKKKKSKKSISHSDILLQNNDNNKANDDNNRLLVISNLLSSILFRTSSFCNALLSEAALLLSANTSLFYIRLLTNSLKGLCDLKSPSLPDGFGTNNASNGLHHHIMFDDQIKNCIVWIESLLDAHFTSYALDCMGDSYVRNTLIALMETMKMTCLNEIMNDMEDVMGTWSHIVRVVQHKSEQVKPMPEIYQIETLQL
eukprot:gene12920-17315_t